jgi:hypothetical protein
MDSGVGENKNASEVAWTRQSTLFVKIFLNYNPNPNETTSFVDFEQPSWG